MNSKTNQPHKRKKYEKEPKSFNCCNHISEIKKNPVLNTINESNFYHVHVHHCSLTKFFCAICFLNNPYVVLTFLNVDRIKKHLKNVHKIDENDKELDYINFDEDFIKKFSIIKPTTTNVEKATKDEFSIIIKWKPLDNEFKIKLKQKLIEMNLINEQNEVNFFSTISTYIRKHIRNSVIYKADLSKVDVLTGIICPSILKAKENFGFNSQYFQPLNVCLSPELIYLLVNERDPKADDAFSLVFDQFLKINRLLKGGNGLIYFHLDKLKMKQLIETKKNITFLDFLSILKYVGKETVQTYKNKDGTIRPHYRRHQTKFDTNTTEWFCLVGELDIQLAACGEAVLIKTVINILKSNLRFGENYNIYGWSCLEHRILGAFLLYKCYMIFKESKLESDSRPVNIKYLRILI